MDHTNITSIRSLHCKFKNTISFVFKDVVHTIFDHEKWINHFKHGVNTVLLSFTLYYYYIHTTPEKLSKQFEINFCFL